MTQCSVLPDNPKRNPAQKFTKLVHKQTDSPLHNDAMLSATRERNSVIGQISIGSVQHHLRRHSQEISIEEQGGSRTINGGSHEQSGDATTEEEQFVNDNWLLTPAQSNEPAVVEQSSIQHHQHGADVVHQSPTDWIQDTDH